MQSLREDMKLLVKRIHDLLRFDYSGDRHHRLCSILADEFDLWDDEERFPIWLSRVVAGEMADAGETT